MKKLLLIAAAALALVGCGHLSSSGEPDLGGYLGRFENRPAKVEGTLGSAPSLADWSNVPVCCQRHRNAYGNDYLEEKKK
jgi:hypothetical protein